MSLPSSVKESANNSSHGTNSPASAVIRKIAEALSSSNDPDDVEKSIRSRRVSMQRAAAYRKRKREAAIQELKRQGIDLSNESLELPEVFIEEILEGQEVMSGVSGLTMSEFDERSHRRRQSGDSSIPSGDSLGTRFLRPPSRMHSAGISMRSSHSRHTSSKASLSMSGSIGESSSSLHSDPDPPTIQMDSLAPPSKASFSLEEEKLRAERSSRSSSSAFSRRVRRKSNDNDSVTLLISRHSTSTPAPTRDEVTTPLAMTTRSEDSSLIASDMEKSGKAFGKITQWSRQKYSSMISTTSSSADIKEYGMHRSRNQGNGESERTRQLTLEESTMQTTQSSVDGFLKTKLYWVAFVGICLVLGISLGVVIGLVLQQTPQSGLQSDNKPTDEQSCELFESEIDTSDAEAQPDIFKQCNCFEEVAKISSATVTRYAEIRGRLAEKGRTNPDGLDEYDTYESLHDCRPSNLATLKLATQDISSLSDNALEHRYLLTLLFLSWGGFEWKIQDKWLSDAHVCDWYGIFCSSNDGVVAIQLSGNSLRGPMIPQIAEFLDLEGRHGLDSIHLDDNRLTGSLPTELFTLDNLQDLNLGGNALTGTFPNEIIGLKSLFDLDLSNNTFSGTIPTTIRLLTKLETFDVSHNKIEGTIVTEIGQLANLENLRLGNNEIDHADPIPEQLWSLGKLRKLDLARCGLEGPLPIDRLSSNFPSLEVMNFEQNSFFGQIPLTIGGMTSLKLLDLSSNELNGQIPYELSNLFDLEYLNLESNNLVGDVPGALCTMLEMGELDELIVDCGSSGVFCSCCTQCDANGN